MREDGIGRVLVASLHQSIADTLPERLGFYENWLSAGGLREGTIGLAPTYAVLSFLRLEERGAYQVIMTRAGQYAAQWTVESMTPMRRSFIRAMPIWLRSRLLIRSMSRLVRSSYAGSRVVGRLRGGTARLDVRASVFCSVREPVAFPLCGYYAAAYTRLLSLFDLETDTQVLSCRGSGDSACILTAPIGKPCPHVSDASQVES